MRRTERRTARLLAAAAFAGPVLLVGACTGETQGPETGADVEDVTQADVSAANIGGKVTVSADVQTVLGPTAFVLAAPDDDGLLVLSAMKPTVEEGALVQVTGTVRQFNLNQFATEYGLEDEPSFEPYATEAFIEATKVSKTVPQEED